MFTTRRHNSHVHENNLDNSVLHLLLPSYNSTSIYQYIEDSEPVVDGSLMVCCAVSNKNKLKQIKGATKLSN